MLELHRTYYGMFRRGLKGGKREGFRRFREQAWEIEG